MKQVVRLNESQLNKIVNKVLLEEQVYTNIDKAYDYKKVNGVWFAKNKKGNKWINISKYTDSIKAIESKLKTGSTNQKLIERLTQKDRVNVVKGFQMFMNKHYKGWYKGTILPTQKLGIVDEITKSSYLKYRRNFIDAIKKHKSNLPWYSWEHISQAISNVGDSIVSGLSSVANGFTNFFRKMFPNVSELFFARDLTTDDFTDSQKEIMYDTIQNAIKRNNNSKVGATEYIDYGDGVEKDWFGVGGVKTSDMVLNTLFSNPKFMVATTLGRFSYKNLGDKIVITDMYDFKKIPDAKTTEKDLEGLSYLGKVMKIKNDNNVSYYVAIRHLGYLEHPDSGLDSKPKINVELNPQDYA